MKLFLFFYDYVRCGLWASSGPFPLSAHYGLYKRGRDPPTNPSRHLKKKECPSLKWLLKEDQGGRPTATTAAATAAAPPRAAAVFAAVTAASPCLVRWLPSCSLLAAAAVAAATARSLHHHHLHPPPYSRHSCHSPPRSSPTFLVRPDPTPSPKQPLFPYTTNSRRIAPPFPSTIACSPSLSLSDYPPFYHPVAPRATLLSSSRFRKEDRPNSTANPPP